MVLYFLEISIDFFSLSFVGKETGEAVWDKKVVNNLRGAVGPSISRPARQYRVSPWRGSDDSNSTPWERNAMIEAFFR